MPLVWSYPYDFDGAPDSIQGSTCSDKHKESVHDSRQAVGILTGPEFSSRSNRNLTTPWMGRSRNDTPIYQQYKVLHRFSSVLSD